MSLPSAIAIGAIPSVSVSIAKALSTTITVRSLLSAPFSPSELAAALRLTEPAPQLVIMGGRFSDEEASEAKKVIDEYLEKERGGKGVEFIKVPAGLIESEYEGGVVKFVKDEVEKKFGTPGQVNEKVESLPPALTLGHRENAVGIGHVLRADNLVNVVAIYSIIPFSPSALAQSLRSAYPPPRAMLCGGFFADKAEEAKKVFEEFRKEVGEGGETTTFVGVPQGLIEKEGKEGVIKYVKEEFAKGFGK